MNKIRRGKMFPLSLWDCETPPPLTFLSPWPWRLTHLWMEQPLRPPRAQDTHCKQGKQLSLSFSPLLHLHQAEKKTGPFDKSL